MTDVNDWLDQIQPDPPEHWSPPTRPVSILATRKKPGPFPVEGCIASVVVLAVILVGVAKLAGPIGDVVTGSLSLAVLVAFGLGMYFIPTIVAVVRGHHNTPAIVVINVLLGWALAGWAVALAWAFTKVEK